MTYKNTRRGFTQTNKVILDLIQDLQRLSLRLINSMRGRCRIKYGMTALYNNSAFTLIELLVVVLIIGILAAVAVPQYQKAVEKSRLAEALLNFKTITDCFAVYKLEHGLPTEGEVYMQDICPLEIALEDMGNEYSSKSKNFEYTHPQCTRTGCDVSIFRFPNYEYALEYKNSGDIKKCFTFQTNIGRYICKSLESQGWEYKDEEY